MMGSTICVEHRDHQDNDLYDNIFGCKSQNEQKIIKVAFHVDDYFYKKTRRKKKKRRNKHLNK